MISLVKNEDGDEVKIIGDDDDDHSVVLGFVL